jgi:Domain of unknown function (DUF222)
MPARSLRQNTRPLDGPEPPHALAKPLREQTLAEELADPPQTGPAATPPGVVMGGQVLAGPLIRRAALNAVIKKVVHPGDAKPEPRYVPSLALADFVRCRDLTCRFPGCDVPADKCDIDHTIPHPAGPTQASNLKCLCRKNRVHKRLTAGENQFRRNPRLRRRDREEMPLAGYALELVSVAVFELQS